MDHEYQKQIQNIAKGLGLGGKSSEEGIIAHCADQVNSLLQEIQVTPKTISQLLDVVAAKLGLGIKEIHSQNDIIALMRDFPPKKEPVMATISLELDEDTHAVVLHRSNREGWEQPYLAIINCLGDHARRRYFSKWHEVVHLLLEGPQMTFAFRRTKTSERQQPLERLVDRVAAHLAFYPSIFQPVLEDEIRAAGRLTFEGINRVRARLAPEASRQATTMACIHQSTHPVTYIRFAMGLKKAEQDMLNQPTLFPGTATQPEPKLRVKECVASPSAKNIRLEMFPNMSLSDSSTVSKVHVTGGDLTIEEDFSSWHDGLPSIHARVEVEKRDSAIHCLIQKA